jgi:hypothetical protein
MGNNVVHKFCGRFSGMAPAESEVLLGKLEAQLQRRATLTPPSVPYVSFGDRLRDVSTLATTDIFVAH